MPTLTQLEYIVAVDTYRHFGEAAQKCFVTQPTLSMQVKKVEEELGVIIFDRSKQPVIPTDIGDTIIAQARIVLREMQRVSELIGDFRNEVSGSLRMGIIPTLAPYLLPVFIGDFLRKYPKINLQVRELPTEDIVQALENDLLDLGILVTPLRQPSIREIPLFYEEIKLYIHPQHELAKNYTEAGVSIEALQNCRFWLLKDGHCFRNQMINLCSISETSPSDRYFQLPFEYESSSFEALQRLVDKEGGFTLLPELAIPQQEGTAKILSLNSTPLREVSLVYVRNFAKIKLLELLKEAILEAIPPHLLQKTRGQLVEWK